MKASTYCSATTNIPSMKEPLLVTAIPGVNAAGSVDKSSSSSHAAQQKKEQLHVHRLVSFLVGAAAGVCLQIVSVVVFAKLITYAQHEHADDIQSILQRETTVAVAAAGDDASNSATTTTVAAAGLSRQYEAILQSEQDSVWFNIAIWMVYHASLAVYLIVWVGMMALAMSKMGWRYISSGLHIPSQVTRRTCFLRTFFFINGFVQGSLVPWIFFELYVGCGGSAVTSPSSFDVVWMPMLHLGVFFVVIFVYDWMKDEEQKDVVGSGKRRGEERDDDDEPNCLV